MSTEYFYFTGKAKWAKTKEPDKAFGSSEYKITLYVDKKTKKDIIEAGVQVTPKEDDEGIYFQFRRPESKLWPNGDLTDFGPPDIYSEDGKTKFDGYIGNGSDVTVKVSVYDTRKGKGHRLEAIRIDTLVPYDGGPKEGF